MFTVTSWGSDMERFNCCGGTPSTFTIKILVHSILDTNKQIYWKYIEKKTSQDKNKTQWVSGSWLMKSLYLISAKSLIRAALFRDPIQGSHHQDPLNNRVLSNYTDLVFFMVIHILYIYCFCIVLKLFLNIKHSLTCLDVCTYIHSV